MSGLELAGVIRQHLYYAKVLLTFGQIDPILRPGYKRD